MTGRDAPAPARGPVPRFDPWLAAILAGGLGLRLIGLTEPLVDQQAWRQADTAAIARNFYEEGLDLLTPRVDWRGTTSGAVEANLPLFSFAVALLYAAVGLPAEWIGRLLAAVLSTAAAALLCAFVRRLVPGPWTGRLAALLYLVTPLSWFFGRAFMPEGLMVFLSAAALLTFLRWLERESAARLALAAAVAGLCFAVKLPTLYLGLPLVALAAGKFGWSFLRRPALWLYLVAALLPPLAWYAHAAALFERTGLTFGIWGQAGYDKWSHHLLATPGFWVTVSGRMAGVVFTPAGAVLVALGLVGLWPREGGLQERWRWSLYAWMGGLVAYLLLVPEGNRKLDYYQLPFVPAGAAFAAAPLAALLGDRSLGGRLGRILARAGGTAAGRAAAALLTAGVLAWSAYAVRDYFRPPGLYDYYRTCQAAGAALDAKLPRGALLVIGDIDDNAGAPFRAQSPTLLYYCHRKGWQITPDQFRPEVLDSLAAAGGAFFVVPAGFAAERPALWQDLLARGLSTAAAYPRFWHDAGPFLEAANRHAGPERHVLVARLQAAEAAGAADPSR